MIIMKRRVAIGILRDAIEKRGSLGKEKLAMETGLVSVATLNRMLSTGDAPNRMSREKLASAVQVSIDELFPEAEQVKRKTK